MRQLHLALALFLCAIAPSCGGSSAPGGGGGGGDDFRQFFSIASLDGEICTLTVDSSSDEMRLGLLGNGDTCRMFVSFDISEFNVNDNINAAGIELFLLGKTNSPFLNFGTATATDIDLGGSLNQSDFNSVGISGSSAFNSSTFRADVGQMLQFAVSEGKPRISIRIEFANPQAPVGSIARFSTASGAIPPRLDVDVGEPNE